MRRALIENATGKVVNVVVVGPGWAPPAGHSLGPDESGSVGDTWNGSAFIPPAPVLPTIAELKAYAASKRWRVETGGVTVGGTQVASDATAQAKINAAKGAVDNVTITGPIDFKTKTGWVTADAAMVSTIYRAVVAHVQAGYTTERNVEAAIVAGTITTFAGIDGAAWPSN